MSLFLGGPGLCFWDVLPSDGSGKVAWPEPPMSTHSLLRLGIELLTENRDHIVWIGARIIE